MKKGEKTKTNPKKEKKETKASGCSFFFINFFHNLFASLVLERERDCEVLLLSV
jgi:hypothetical protein